MPIYNLIEYSDNYSKTSGSLWQYCRDEPVLTDAGAITNFSVVDNSAPFRFKQKITGKTAAGGTKNVEAMVALTWCEKCVLSNDTKAKTFAIIDTKIYVLVVTLSTQDNAKLLQQFK